MDDLISRAAAIDALRYAELGCELEVIEALPSAERKKGRWLERKVTYIDDLEVKDIIPSWQSAKCNVCGKYHTTPYMYYFSDDNYCPNCGAQMRGEDDE